MSMCRKDTPRRPVALGADLPGRAGRDCTWQPAGQSVRAGADRRYRHGPARAAARRVDRVADPYDDATLAQFLDQSAYAGTIFLGQSQFHDTLNRYADLGKPLVAWGVEVAGQSYCSIGSDNHEGGFQATAHLLRKGRRRIAFIGATPPIAAARTPFRRLRSDWTAIARRWRRMTSRSTRPWFRRRPPGGSKAEAVDNLLERGIAFDAIVAASDLVALGAIRRCASAACACRGCGGDRL